MSFLCSPENASNGWRQRGYEAGQRGVEPKPPEDEEHARAYMVGYRRGTQRRQEVASSR